MTPPGFLTIDKFAHAVGVCERTARRLVKFGTVKAYRPSPHRIFVKATEVGRFIEKRTK